MTTIPPSSAASALAAVFLIAGPTAGAAGVRRDHPVPSHFAARVDNPWFPLRPGTTLVYRGHQGAKAVRDVFRVTKARQSIQGVRCTVVDDRVYLEGRLSERTTDWYAQDRAGTVWYFGERTAELDARGRVVSREGSWRAGVRRARAGVFMPAHPRVGQSFRQEYFEGHAEDHFRVLGRAARVRAPAVSSRHALLTREWTPLEPGVIDHKLYVRGIGTVLEQTVRGGSEKLVLVSVRRGGRKLR